MPCTCMHLADLPELKHLQNRKKCIKRAKLAGVVINNMLELKHTMLLHHQQLPKSVSTALVVAKTAEQRGLVYYVPMDAAAFHVEGVVFTGRQQIQWVGQLHKMPWLFVLHIDGKYKLHHGNTWVLLTLGCHGLRCADELLTIT